MSTAQSRQGLPIQNGSALHWIALDWSRLGWTSLDLDWAGRHWIVNLTGLG